MTTYWLIISFFSSRYALFLVDRKLAVVPWQLIIAIAYNSCHGYCHIWFNREEQTEREDGTNGNNQHKNKQIMMKEKNQYWYSKPTKCKYECSNYSPGNLARKGNKISNDMVNIEPHEDHSEQWTQSRLHDFGSIYILAWFRIIQKRLQSLICESFKTVHCVAPPWKQAQ